jgi:SAM-dependent methyltransferase
MAVPPDRAHILRKGIEPGKSLAIEVGPLDRPVLGKPKFNVRYVDFADTQTLKTKYADDPGVGHVAEVDLIWDGHEPLTKVVDGGLFDAVVAAHVIEHVPDPVGWLAKFAQILRPGGLINLAIPDKRVTFDVNRRLTDIGDLVDAFVRQAAQPTFGQIYDFHTRSVVPADAMMLWSGQVEYSQTARSTEFAREVLTDCRNMRPDSPYVDVHCNVFTPSSFVDLIAKLSELELIDFTIAELVPTKPNTIEFYVRLERIDSGSSLEEISRLREEGLRRARAAVESAPAPVPYMADKPEVTSKLFVVSEREQHFVELGRQAVARARRILGPPRRRLRKLRHR